MERAAELVRIGLALLVLASAAAPAVAASPPEARAHVGERAPRAHSPDLSLSDDGADAGVQVHPSAGNHKSVQVKVRVDDDNGHNDVATVTVTIYKPDNATVHREAATAGKQTGNGRRAVYAHHFQMAYHDAPGAYHVRAEATDRDGDASTAWATFTYTPLAAVSLNETVVRLSPNGTSDGAVAPGGDTLDAPARATVENTGNVAVDLQYSGTDLTRDDGGDDRIRAERVRMAYAQDMAGHWGLSPEPAVDTDFNLPPGEGSSRDVYFAIQVPEGVAAGAYTGEVTLSGVANQ